MKNALLTSLSCAVLGFTAANAQDMIESFDYILGEIGSTPSTGSGEIGNWGGFSTGGKIGGSADGTISEGSLTAPTDYAFTPSNNQLTHSATAKSVSNSMVNVDPAIAIDFDSDNTYYISFLESHTASAPAFHLQSQLQLRDGDNNTLLQIGFFAGKLRALATASATGSPMSNGQDRLLVFKIEASSAGNDIIRGSFFDSGLPIGTEPETWDLNLTTDAITGQATFFNATLGAKAGEEVTHTTRMDEIRFGTKFSDVAAP